MKMYYKQIVFVILMVWGLILCPYAFSAEPLNIYSVSGDLEHQLFTPFFKQEGGLDVQFLKFQTGTLRTRVLAEATTGKIQADICMPTHEVSLEFKEKGFFLPYKSKAWDNIKVPDILRDPDGYWYGWAYWMAVIIVNKEILNKKGLTAPKSWNDLIQPKWKGEIVMPNPGTSGTAYMMVSTVIQIMGEQKAWDYLEKLDKNVAQYTKSGAAPADLVARGEYAIGITWDLPPFEKKEAGYPVELIAPEEGTGFQLDTVSIFKGTKKVEAAKKFIDLIATKKFMELAGQRRSKVTMPGVKSRVIFEPKLIKYDAVRAAENKDRIMNTWKEKFAK